ncbi:MAG: MFS transporter, partial [Pseudomonadota bacterium]
HRDFRRLWMSTFFATGGQWIQQATLGWVVYELTGSASVLGAVLGMRAIPMLLLAPLTGVVADRFDRRYALAASQLLIIAMSIALAVLLATKTVEVWHLFVFSIMSGVSDGCTPIQKVSCIAHCAAHWFFTACREPMRGKRLRSTASLSA